MSRKTSKRDIYLNNPNLPTVDAQFEYTPEMVNEMKECSENVLYFAENYFFIISVDEGKQKIKLHVYQKRALRMMRDNRFSLLLFSRQTGKSTISTIFCLWTACFNKDQNILIVANKESTAKEIFKRVRLAYEELPNWLKPGVREYGKESMELANGSRIGIATTTGTAGRGSSANLLFVDEADWIECVSADTQIALRDKNTGKVQCLTIGDAHKLYDNTSCCLEVLTHAGWRNCKGVTKHSNGVACKLKFNDNTSLVCSIDHELLTSGNNFTRSIDSRGKKIKAADNILKTVVSVKILNEFVDLYDVTNVDGGVYLTNGVVSHNCHLLDDFWASVYPIISSSKKSKIIMASTPRDTSGLFYKLYKGSLDGENNWAHMKIIWNEVPGRDEKWKRETIGSLSDPTVFAREFECMFEETGESVTSAELHEKLKRRCSEPQHIYMDGAYKLWDMPRSDRLYVAGVDVSEGVSKDYTIVNILDITDLKNINQVAIFTSNIITPTEFTPKLHEILQHWGKPLVLVERNNCGAQVVDNLRKDFFYDNIVSHGAREIGRTKIPLGVISHSNSKYDCVLNQRYWISTLDAVQINDIQTVEELKDFIRYPNGSWKARLGKNDDRVMSLFWGLFILFDKLVNKYFDVIALDENHKPAMLRALDYGIKYFQNPTSMYVDEKNGESVDALPVSFGSDSQQQDIDDLKSMGWEFLQ